MYNHVFIRLNSGASGYVSSVVAWPLVILIGQAARNSPIKMSCSHSTTVALQKRNQMIQTQLLRHRFFFEIEYSFQSKVPDNYCTANFIYILDLNTTYETFSL